jgi:hypothetical protein
MREPKWMRQGKEIYSKALADAEKHSVRANVRQTKTGCPYLRVLGTGARVDFVTAKGGKEAHVYFNTYFSSSMYMGKHPIHKSAKLIRVYGGMSPRNMIHALGYAGISNKKKDDECMFMYQPADNHTFWR